jgi:hypothetical protein
MARARRPWNPFRSEASAYQFLLITVGYFAAIVAASLAGGTWAGLAVFIVLTIVGIAWIFLRGRVEVPVRQAPRRQGEEGVKRILVAANETVGGRRLRQEIEQAAAGVSEQVFVVCPALNSPLKHWVSDDDEARREAHRRLNRSLRQLEEDGIAAFGEVGDSDPIQAIEDALRSFAADQIIISTHPEGRSNWLERGVVSSARERFAVPITHVVVDLEAEAETARSAETSG